MPSFDTFTYVKSVVRSLISHKTIEFFQTDVYTQRCDTLYVRKHIEVRHAYLVYLVVSAGMEKASLGQRKRRLRAVSGPTLERAQSGRYR